MHDGFVSVSAAGVQDGDEAGRELPLFVAKREVFLMITHHRDQHLFGKHEDLFSEGADGNARRFDEIDDVIGECGIGTDLESGDDACLR